MEDCTVKISVKESDKKVSNKDLKIIKVINDIYEKNGEIKSEKSVEEIKTGLSDAGLRVTDKYLKAMLDKSQEMLDAGIGDIEKESITEDVEKTFEGPVTDKELELSKLIADGIKDEYETIKLYNDIAFIARKHGRDDIAKLIDNINTEENNHVGMLQQALRTISANADAVESGDKEALDYLNDDDFKIDATESNRLSEAPSFDLAPTHDARKSFYGKARVDIDDKGSTLYSYNVPVVRIVDGKVELLPRWNEPQTTLRHVKEFLKQYGFRADSLAQIGRDYEFVNESLNEEVNLDVNDPKLKEIFNNVNDGKSYGETIKDSRFPAFWEVLTLSPNKEYIRYRHYGSSAVKNDIRELVWVLSTIFQMTPSEFINNYDCKTEDEIIDILDRREVNEGLGSEVDEYQKWVDYDMKKYGRISDITNSMINRAGFEIIKDKYGDYEVTTKSDKSGLSDTMKEYQKWVDYDLKRYGMVSDKTQSDIEKAGFKLVKDDHGDYEVIV